MHRKHIRATVGTGDVDIPTGTFTANRFLYYNGISIITLVAVQGPVSSTDNAVARWDGTSGALLQNSTVQIDDAGNMTGVTSINGVPDANWVRYLDPDGFLPLAREIVVFQNGSNPITVTYANGPKIDITGAIIDVTTINARDPMRWTDGPAAGGSTDSAVALWDGTTGRLLKNSVVTVNTGGDITTPGDMNPTTVAGIPRGVLVKSSSPTPHTDNAVARWDNASGHPLQDSVVIISDTGAISGATTLNGITISQIVRNTAAPTPVVNQSIATFNGTSGTNIIDCPVTINGSGAIANATTLNGKTISNIVLCDTTSVVDDVPYYADTTGKLIRSSGLSVNQVVTTSSLGASTDNAVVRFNGITGKIIQNSVVIVSDTGAVTGITTLNGVSPSSWVVGPGSVPDNAIARFDGTTGKLIQNSAVLIDDSQNITNAGTYNGVNVAAHASRHMPGGADAIFSGTWASGDVISWTGSTFTNRYVRMDATGSGSAGASYLTLTNAIVAERSMTGANVLILIPYVLSDSGSDFQILAQWFNCTARCAISCGLQGGVITSSGGTGTLDAATGQMPAGGLITVQFYCNSFTSFPANIALGIRSLGSAHTIYPGICWVMEDA